jgi:Xaa-Pro aminopeptidase
MLDPKMSKGRQKRLLDAMQERKLDAVVVGSAHHVNYLSAFLPNWLHHAGFILFSDGRSWLATANQPAKNTAADDVASYEAQWNATLRQEQPEVVAEMVIDRLKSRRAKRIGIDWSPVTASLAMSRDYEFESIEPILWQHRRRKDADELALMKTAIRASEAMFKRAREIIEPGIPEIHVFNELHHVGVEAVGERFSAILGNDYVCGKGGGPPRAGRTAQAGEIYILDLGPSYRGYFADNCRAFAVDRNPTDEQQRAREVILECLALVERLAKPGTRCRDLFSAVDDHMKSRIGRGMPHHLGHGVGLQPHEYPHLNPKWDDVLIEGEFFACEPGIYGENLRGGIRIENNYLVTPAGVENLLNSPTELV